VNPKAAAPRKVATNPFLFRRRDHHTKRHRMLSITSSSTNHEFYLPLLKEVVLLTSVVQLMMWSQSMCLLQFRPLEQFRLPPFLFKQVRLTRRLCPPQCRNSRYRYYGGCEMRLRWGLCRPRIRSGGTPAAGNGSRVL